MRGVCMSQAPGGWELTSDDSRVQLSELDYLGQDHIEIVGMWLL